MHSVLFLTCELCAIINKPQIFIKSLSCAWPHVKHFTDSFNPQKIPMGVIMSVLQMRNLATK